MIYVLIIFVVSVIMYVINKLEFDCYYSNK